MEKEELYDSRARNTIANRAVIAANTVVIRRRFREMIVEVILLFFVITSEIDIRRGYVSEGYQFFLNAKEIILHTYKRVILSKVLKRPSLFAMTAVYGTGRRISRCEPTVFLILIGDSVWFSFWLNKKGEKKLKYFVIARRSIILCDVSRIRF